jgi:acetylcholinesterase
VLPLYQPTLRRRQSSSRPPLSSSTAPTRTAVYIGLATCTALLLVLLLLLLLARAQTAEPRVDTQQGTIQGKALNSLVNEYLGVPFAVPPTGNNAFKYAQYPPSSYSTATDNATAAKPFCTGLYGSEISGSNDCLYLDLWTPSTATADSQLPVYVFIPYVATLYIRRCASV